MHFALVRRAPERNRLIATRFKHTDVAPPKESVELEMGQA
jgi:hypothetical protein